MTGRRRDLYPFLGDGIVRPLGQLLYRIRIHGRERIPSRGGVILAANHDSMVDPFVLGIACLRPVRFMAKAELWSNPVVGWLLDGMGSFPVRRAAGDREATARAVDLLEAGEVVGIFPEGTAIPYRRRPFGRGAARLALATGAPIVPVALLHTERALRPVRPKLGLPRLHVLVAPPIAVEPAAATVARARALTRRVEEAIADLRRPYGPPAHAWLD
jgi:1-acyl-sn-glycerol-3-phosphate acyltransferase